jgi:hypothetical protein
MLAQMQMQGATPEQQQQVMQQLVQQQMASMPLNQQVIHEEDEEGHLGAGEQRSLHSQHSASQRQPSMRSSNGMQQRASNQRLAVEFKNMNSVIQHQDSQHSSKASHRSQTERGPGISSLKGPSNNMLPAINDLRGNS